MWHTGTGTHTHIHQHTKQVMRRNWGLGWGRPSGLTAFWCGGAFTRRKFVVSSSFGGASWQKPQPQARLVEVWRSIKRFLELLTSSSSRRALEEHLYKSHNRGHKLKIVSSSFELGGKSELRNRVNRVKGTTWFLRVLNRPSQKVLKSLSDWANMQNVLKYRLEWIMC